MGTLILISGANSSGKSAFAEQLIGKTQGERYYIATMIPHTKDNYLRIEKHRHQRERLDFHTLELPYQVGEACVTADSTALLEDVSNLLANNIFEKGNSADSVFQDICKLTKRCRRVVAVTISGLDGSGYDEETAAYIDSLNKLNKKLFDIAAAAITMQDKAPVYQKGEIHDVF